MSFDKDSNLPLINPHKRTTKVNFAIVIAVIVFLAICAGVIVWLNDAPHRAIPPAEKKVV